MNDTFTREVRVDLAEGDGRTLIARLVPYNEVTTVNDGGGEYQEEFLPGAFDGQMRAANRIRAFLNFRHRQGISDVIGHAAKIEDREDGLHGELRVLDTQNGDTALRLVEAGQLDRLSIEFASVTDRVVNGVTQRVKARLLGVALVPQGAYDGAAVLAVREDEGEDEEPPVEEDPVAAVRTVEPPPPLNAEMLERVGIDTMHRAFTTKPWDGSASKYADTAAYCTACLVDDNPAGADKVQSLCHLPIKEPNGDININAVRNALARVGQTQMSAANKSAAKTKLQRLLTQYQNSSGAKG